MHARIYPAGWRPVAFVLIIVVVSALTIALGRRPQGISRPLSPMEIGNAPAYPYTAAQSFVTREKSAALDASRNMAPSSIPETDAAESSTLAAASSPALATDAVHAAGLRLPSMDPSADVSRMIIRSGYASVEVRSVDSATPLVRALADQIGGFIANSSIEGGRDQPRTARFEIKAPAQNFDRLVSGLSPLGKLESVNVTAEDVGEEYVDVNARITNDRRLEDRLVQLLATRTGKLKDVLDVEHELARVREEIERQEGRLRYLRTRTELSTLTVTVHEPVPIINRPGDNPFELAVRRAWRNFVAVAAFAIASLGVLIPVGLIGAAAWLLFGRRRPAIATIPEPKAAS
jgi:hypothetical protein